ncbi:MAG: DegT/DnrJ/EryC1/StrS family aminotransferase [Candidatus Altiarchaeota archaeon]
MIPVYEPLLGAEERKNLLEAFDSGWTSSKGAFIGEFEESFAKYVGVKHAVATSNGTTALHLALEALGVGAGDEVIVPTLTFVSTANAVAYTGAKPVFVDSQPDYWCIDPDKIREKITEKTKAIIPVHLYGHPCDMDPILEIAEEHNLFVIEDAAEAHGAEYKGRKVGCFGDVNCFSFFGNKIITTGEGGMCVTNDEKICDKMQILRDHGTNPNKHYWCDVRGFNYRMTNLQAALGCAQVDRIDDLIEKKRSIALEYNKRLGDVAGVSLPPEESWARNVYWMYSVLIADDIGLSRDDVMKKLSGNGVESRPFFPPIHKFPMYDKKESFPVAEELSKKGINLPSSPKLTKEDVKRVAEAVFSLA